MHQDQKLSAAFMLAGASLIALAGAVAIATPASAQTAEAPRRAISLPAMSLDRSLARIGQRDGAQITFDRGDAAQYQAPAINADSVAEAIQQALSQSPLSVETKGNRFVVGRQSRIDPSDIVVTARRDEAETDYGARTASTATRDGGTLRSQPQSTTVITAKVLADQQIQTVSDALRNASGAAVSYGNIQAPTSYSVRGFNVTPTSNGLVSTGANAEPIANIERIEVLKGPAAILQGQDNLGGVINIVRKRPTADPLLDVTAEYGSYNDVRGVIDGSTALSANRAVSARLILAGARADRNSAGYDGRREYLIAPSLRYKFAKSDFIIGTDMSHQAGPLLPYAYFDDDRHLIDVSGRVIGPKNQGVTQDLNEFYYEATQGIGDWLTLVSRGQHSDNKQVLRILGPAFYIGPNTLFFTKFTDRQDLSSDAIDSYARLKFKTFGLRHTLIGGYNYSKSVKHAFTAPELESDPGGLVLDLSALDPIPAFRAASVPVNITTSNQDGYYVQDLIEFGPVHLTAGARRTETSGSNFVISNGRTTRQARGATVPNFGAVIDLSPRVSLYANYMEGFTPTSLLNRAGEFLPNGSSQNIEAGVKADLADGRLSIVASVYRLRENGLTLSDLSEPELPDIYVTLPGQESHGVEFNVNGRILPGWQIAASYSYAKYKQQDPAEIDPVLGQPAHTYSLFTTYEVPHGRLKSLGAGLGIYGFSSSRAGFADLDEGRVFYTVPGQTEVDANFYYTLGKFRLNFGVTNVLDSDLFGVASNTTYIPKKEPRTFRLTVIYRMF